MFCPEGFFALSEVYSTIFFQAEEYCTKLSLLNGTEIYDRVPIEGDEEAIVLEKSEAHFLASECWALWALHMFIRSDKRGDLFVASPSGSVLRLLRDRLYVSAGRPHGIPATEPEQEKYVEKIEESFIWFDSENFTISVEKAILWGFGEGSEVDWMRHVDGWIVCWKPPDDKFSLSTFIASLLNQDELVAMPSVSIAPRPRGNPGKHEGLLQRTISNLYMERLKKDDLPYLQRESILTDAMDWTKRIMGEDVSRTTMQRYLAPVFKVMDARK